MSLDTPPVKRPRGRPRKTPILTPVDTVEADTSIEDQEDDASVAVAEEDVDEKFNFISTGNAVKDRALKGVIVDAPALFQAASAAKVWDNICKSANPAGECERFAIAQFVKDPTKIISTLFQVKKMLTPDRNGMTVIKAYQSYDLKDMVERVLNVDKPATDGIAVTPVEAPIAVEAVVETPVSEPIAETPVAQEPVIETVVKIDPIIYVKGSVVTNPADASQTWTIGSRGRKPSWFIALNCDVAPDQIVDSVITIKTESATPLTFEDGETVFNPLNKDQMYVVGTRGRRPDWFTNLLENGSAGKRVTILPANIRVNPDDHTQQFDISKPGRRPNWLK